MNNTDHEKLPARNEAEHICLLARLLLAFIVVVMFLISCVEPMIMPAWHRFKFWLTVSIVCRWCDKVNRRAWFGRPDRVSHGICRACLQREIGELITTPHNPKN